MKDGNNSTSIYTEGKRATMSIGTEGLSLSVEKEFPEPETMLEAARLILQLAKTIEGQADETEIALFGDHPVSAGNLMSDGMSRECVNGILRDSIESLKSSVYQMRGTAKKLEG
jgi:hypothetical protein